MEPEDLYRQFGARVKVLRKRAVITQEVLAARIGKDVDTVSNIERGRHAPKLATAYAIATALNVSLSELFEFDDDGEAEKEKRRVLDALVRRLARHDITTIKAVERQADILLKIAERDRDG